MSFYYDKLMAQSAQSKPRKIPILGNGISSRPKWSYIQTTTKLNTQTLLLIYLPAEFLIVVVSISELLRKTMCPWRPHPWCCTAFVDRLSSAIILIALYGGRRFDGKFPHWLLSQDEGISTSTLSKTASWELASRICNEALLKKSCINAVNNSCTTSMYYVCM